MPDYGDRWWTGPPNTEIEDRLPHLMSRNSAPTGYLELRAAIDCARRRMFSSGLPPWLIEAAKLNWAEARSLTAYQGVSISAAPKRPASDPDPKKLIVDALVSTRLALFFFSKNVRRVTPVPADRVNEILDKLVFPATREAVAFRMSGFLPARVLMSFDLPRIGTTPIDKFGLCLKERAFDVWLAETARQQGWPLDVARPSGRGRPPIIPTVMPIVKDIIDSGRWQQGNSLKALVVSIQSKMTSEKLDRETVKKAMDELYKETRQLAYRMCRESER